MASDWCQFSALILTWDKYDQCNKREKVIPTSCKKELYATPHQLYNEILHYSDAADYKINPATHNNCHFYTLEEYKYCYITKVNFIVYTNSHCYVIVVVVFTIKG